MLLATGFESADPATSAKYSTGNFDLLQREVNWVVTCAGLTDIQTRHLLPSPSSVSSSCGIVITICAVKSGILLRLFGVGSLSALWGAARLLLPHGARDHVQFYGPVSRLASHYCVQ